MTRPAAVFEAFVLLVCAVLSGCGTTGGTRTFALRVHPPNGQPVRSELRVGSAGMEAEAADLRAQYVVHWGEFGAEDLKHIEASLRDTLSPHVLGPSVATGSRLDIHFVVRRYAVRTSNTAGAVLACVAWAATNADGGVIFREQFFSSHAGRFVGTIGRIKDSVNVAIVRRIATTALELAADPETMPQAREFQDTYASFDEAVTPLPRFLVSLGDPSLAAFPFRELSVVEILTPSGISTVEWETAEPSVEFDWETYLGRLRKAR